MAKMSAINKNNRRIKLSDKFYEKRKKLKQIIMNKKLSFEERLIHAPNAIMDIGSQKNTTASSISSIPWPSQSN